MSYLDRLLELEKKSGERQSPYCQNRQKPSNTPFDPFGSTPPGVSENFTSTFTGSESQGLKTSDHGDAKFPEPLGGVPTEPTKANWWRIYRNGKFLCVVMDPHGLSRDEALKAAKAKWPESEIEVKR